MLFLSTTCSFSRIELRFIIMLLNIMGFQVLDHFPEHFGDITLRDFMHAYALGKQFHFNISFMNLIQNCFLAILFFVPTTIKVVACQCSMCWAIFDMLWLLQLHLERGEAWRESLWYHYNYYYYSFKESPSCIYLIVYCFSFSSIFTFIFSFLFLRLPNCSIDPICRFSESRWGLRGSCIKWWTQTHFRGNLRVYVCVMCGWFLSAFNLVFASTFQIDK